MKKILEACVTGSLLLCAAAVAQTSAIYVDFGSSGLKTASPDANRRYWNNVTELTTAGLDNLVSEVGEPSGISLAVNGIIQTNPFGTTVPDPAALGGLAVSSATQDWFYVYDPNVITVILGNLAPDGIYRLSLFGSRDSEDTRVTKFEVVGQTTEVRRLTTGGLGIGLAPQANANRTDLSLIENLSPAPDGTLTVTVRRDIGPYGYLGALRLETMNAVNYPPAATGVAVSGAPRAGSNLVGRYSYWDKEGDPEGGSRFYWEVADSPTSPATSLSMPSASALNFIPSSNQAGKYLRLCVLPVASKGRPSGALARSGWLGPVVSSDTTTTFHIGSSYTLWSNIPKQISDLTNSSGRKLMTGGQLTAGRDSAYHWSAGLGGSNYFGMNGTIYDLGTPSRLEIPTRSWDVVVLQPYNTEWESWQRSQMYDYSGRFCALADANGSQFYLYAYWCKITDPIATQDEINRVFEQVRSNISVGRTKPALIIPAGQALRAVVEQAGTGDLAGLTRSSFYLAGDDRHPSDLGGYVSALTHYATINKVSPVGLSPRTIDAGFTNDNVVQISPSVATRIQQIVWSVVSSYPNSGVTATLQPVVPPTQPVYVTHSAINDPATIAFAFGPSLDGVSAPPSNLPHPVTTGNAGQLMIEYTINPDAETQQVTFSPEWSSDLVHWTAAQPQGFVQTRIGQKVAMSWTNATPEQFVRIYVVKP